MRANLNGINLSDDSKPWLIQNLDPFHDGQFVMGAPPTQSQMDSTVFVQRARVTLKPGVDTQGHCTGNLSLFMPPVVLPSTFMGMESPDSANVSIRDYGGIMVCDYYDKTLDPHYTCLKPFNAPSDGAWRVVGFGYELTNTTPQMYQSGSMVTYQSPSTVYKAGTGSYCSQLLGTAPGVSMLLPSTSTFMPAPSTIDEATSLPTAKQWDAKHGCYLIPRLTHFDSDFNGPDCLGTVDAKVGTMSLANATSVTDSVLVQPNLVGTGPSLAISHSTGSRVDSDVIPASVGNFYSSGATMPYSATGVHFTGLSPESTFTLVVTYFIQVCPFPYSALAKMVVPTPAYDPRVYEIYTKVMRAVPLATYKDDNDFGTWFKKVIGMVARVAGPVGAALGIPAAGRAVGTIASGIAALPGRKRQPPPTKNGGRTSANDVRNNVALARAIARK